MNKENRKSLWILRNRDSDFVRTWQQLFYIADNIQDWPQYEREDLRRLIKEAEETDLLLSRHPKLRKISDALTVRPERNVENIVNVHDSRLSPARQESELFLSNQVKVEGLIPEEAFTGMVNAIKALPNAQPETCNYLDFLLNKHKENDFNLNVVKVLFQAWHLTKNEDIAYDSDLLLDVLQERATVYKGTSYSFFPGEDFSCHEGTAEQLLDSVTPTRVALTPDDEITALQLYTEYYSQFYSLISNSQGEYIIERNLTLNERAQDILYSCAVEALPNDTVEIEPIVDDLSPKVLERFYNKFNPIAESVLFDLAFTTKEKTGRERLLEITKEFLLMNDYKLEDGQEEYIGEDELASRQTAAINNLKTKKVIDALKNNIDIWMDSYEEAIRGLFDYQKNEDMSVVLELLESFGITKALAETLYREGFFNPELTNDEQEQIEQMSKFVPLDIQAEVANLNGVFEKIADSVMRCFLLDESLCLPATNHEARLVKLNRNLLTTDALLNALYDGNTMVYKAIINHPDFSINALINRGTSGLIPLVVAAEKGYLDFVKAVFAHPDFSVNMLSNRDRYEQNALLSAASGGHTEILKVILDFPNLPMNVVIAHNDSRDNALILALYGKHREMAEIILAYPNLPLDMLIVPNELGNNALRLAIKNGYLDIVNTILAKPNLPNDIYTDRSRSGRNILMTAAEFGQVEAFRAILAQSNCPISTLTTQNHFGENVLISAAQRGNIDIVNTILAQPNLPSNLFTDSTIHGYNALMYAAKRGYVEIFKAILESRQCPRSALTAQSMLEESALSFAIGQQCLDIVNAILAQPSLPSSLFTDRVKFCTNVLMFAVDNGFKDIISSLLAYPGLPITAFEEHNRYRHNVLIAAIENNDMDTIRAILTYPNLPDHIFTDKSCDDRNALVFAAMKSNVDMVNAILAYPTLPNSVLTDKNNRGYDILNLVLNNPSNNAKELVEAIVNKKQKSTGLTFTDRLLLLRYGYLKLSASGMFSIDINLVRSSSSSSDQLNNANQTMEGSPPQAATPDPTADNRQGPDM